MDLLLFLRLHMELTEMWIHFNMRKFLNIGMNAEDEQDIGNSTHYFNYFFQI